MPTTHIDWYSFTLRFRNRIQDYEYAREQINRKLIDILGHGLYDQIFVDSMDWKMVGGRTPYRAGWENKDMGCWVWYGGQSTVLIEFTGRGTQSLRTMNLLRDVVDATASMVTRIDVAIDIVCETTPSEFVEAGLTSRIKTKVLRKSKTGDTYEIGSRTGDKFCRVYRFVEPHPRAKNLRVEYELHSGQARIVTAYWLAYDTQTVADMLTKTYQWRHPMTPKFNDLVDAMPADTSKRTSGKTLEWLIKQCAPAFKRLVHEGLIDNPVEFLETHFLDDKPRQTTLLKDENNE